MVADLRTDPSRQINAYMDIGSGFGSAFGGMEANKIREKRELDKLYLEFANEQFLGVLNESSANQWPADKTHAAVMGIRNVSKLKSFEQWTMMKQRARTKPDIDSHVANITKWQNIKSKAFDNDNKELEAISDEQIRIATENLQRSFGTNKQEQPIETGETNPRQEAGYAQTGVAAREPGTPQKRKPLQGTPVNMGQFGGLSYETNIKTGDLAGAKVDAEIEKEIVGPPEPQYDADYYDRNTPPDVKIKHKVSYATSEPDKAADSWRQAIKKLGGTDKDFEDLKRLFREGNEQKIAEAIRRMMK